MTNKVLYEQIASAIKFDECITVLGFKDDGVSEFVQMLSHDEKKYDWFQKKVGSEVVLKTFGVKFLRALNKPQAGTDVLDVLGLSENIKQAFAELVDQPKKVVLIVTEIDKLDDPAEAISQFDELLKYYGHKISCIYLLEDVSIFLNVQSRLASNSSFFENTYIHPLEGKTEKEALEGMCIRKYGKLKSKTITDKVFKNSYGHYELYKRLYKAEVTKNFESLDSYVKRLVRSFGGDALKIFRKLVNTIDLDEREQEIVDLYCELGFIKKGDISIPILRKYILDLTPRSELGFDKKSGRLILQNIQHFSKTEITILRAFVEQEGEIVTKEDIGRVVWGKKFADKYSPWAIDQSIFRLRLKMDKLHIAGKIKTVHGKGYIFTKN